MKRGFIPLSLLEILRQRGASTPEEVATALGMSRGTVKYQLDKLVTMGRVTREVYRDAPRQPRIWVRTPNEVWPPVRRAYYAATREET